MLISILTLFPEIFAEIFSFSILGRAQKKGLLQIRMVNIRDFAQDKHQTVDDKPYGGGKGMIMRVDIVEKAIAASRLKGKRKEIFSERVVLLDPKGEIFSQKKAREYAAFSHLILVCGHYEGIDERISYFVDEKLSIGQYVLTGGEIPAMVVVDAVSRLIPGVLSSEALENESFARENFLEEPQYTRPAVYKKLKVPAILLSGHHQKIRKWRQKHQISLVK